MLRTSIESAAQLPRKPVASRGLDLLVVVGNPVGAALAGRARPRGLYRVDTYGSREKNARREGARESLPTADHGSPDPEGLKSIYAPSAATC